MQSNILLVFLQPMISFERFVLSNGLKVLVHEDNTTPMAVVDVIYDVGARDEDPNHTGFAHLFEHLMFGGSVNIPIYDEPLQRAGGENNAFTTNDLTNYYCQLPVENIETAFWLESDRMISLAFNAKSLEVQRKVVCEEFKEHYINKPYGDVWHKLRTMAYKHHPYRWMTIGDKLEHIEKATLEEVKSFFQRYYHPANAVLVVAGNITVPRVRELAEKWFGEIKPGTPTAHNYEQEPEQTEARQMTVEASVPFDALYKCWHICSRTDAKYYGTDLLTDILGGGSSSRLYQALVKEQHLFSSISCYHLGASDAGLLTIEGKLIKGVDIKKAELALNEQLQRFKQKGVTNEELEKVKNKTESAMAFEDISLMNRASSLAMYEIIGDANMMNTDLAKYREVTTQEILELSNEIFREKNSNTLYYLAKNKVKE